MTSGALSCPRLALRLGAGSGRFPVEDLEEVLAYSDDDERRGQNGQEITKGCAKEDENRMFEREECRDVRWYNRDKQEREADGGEKGRKEGNTREKEQHRNKRLPSQREGEGNTANKGPDERK